VLKSLERLSFGPVVLLHTRPRSIASLSPRQVFAGTALGLVQKRPVDLFDMDATALNRFDRIGDLDQLAGGFFRVGGGGRRQISSGAIFQENLSTGPARRCVPSTRSHRPYRTAARCEFRTDDVALREAA
jgi:hypothetical protein